MLGKPLNSELSRCGRDTVVALLRLEGEFAELRGGAMGVAHGSRYLPMDDDPDDYRPTSSWSLPVDPDHRIRLSVIRETTGVGDRSRATGTTSSRWCSTSEVMPWST